MQLVQIVVTSPLILNVINHERKDYHSALLLNFVYDSEICDWSQFFYTSKRLNQTPGCDNQSFEINNRAIMIAMREIGRGHTLLLKRFVAFWICHQSCKSNHLTRCNKILCHCTKIVQTIQCKVLLMSYVTWPMKNLVKKMKWQIL